MAGLLTRLPPLDLLDALLAIEQRQGRDRRADVRWGPRRIDLDLLVYGDLAMDTDRLVIPHPGIASEILYCSHCWRSPRTCAYRVLVRSGAS